MGCAHHRCNRGNGPSEIETVMTQMAQYRPAGVYLMAQSNAGMPQYVNGAIHYDGTPAIMADFALRLRNLGVNIIGACCGSTGPCRCDGRHSPSTRMNPLQDHRRWKRRHRLRAPTVAARAAARRSERRRQL
ncbi:MAG: homocysteine S-methyltransferase family protein [Caldilineaceae bacterium]